MTTELTEAKKLIPPDWVRLIKESPQKIEEELAKDYGPGNKSNPWLACFINRLTILQLKLDSNKLVPKEIIDALRHNLDKITKRTQEMTDNNDCSPSEEDRQKLLTALQNLI